MKAKKDLITILLIAGIIIYIIICVQMSFVTNVFWFGYGAHNSNAKLVYTNTATIIDKYKEENNKAFPDGIYSGSLEKPVSSLTYTQQLENAEYTDHYEYFHQYINYLMGGKESSGYYCTVISDNLPVASYWSDSSVIAEYSEQLGIIAQNNLNEKGVIKKRYYFGAYPNENRGKDNISLDHSGNKLPLYSDESIGISFFGIPYDRGNIHFDAYVFMSIIFGRPFFYIFIILLALRIRALHKMNDVKENGEMYLNEK